MRSHRATYSLLTRRRLLAAAGLAPLAPLSRAGTSGLPDLPALIAASKPAIVAVGVHAPLQTPRFRFHGTGFAVGNGRQVITCAHVVPVLDPEKSESIAIVLPGSENARAVRSRVAAIDRDVDLALLEVEGISIPSLQLGAPSDIHEGADVVLMGFPIGGALGLFVASHRGMIAAITPMVVPAARSANLKAQSVQVMRGAPIQLLQLDLTAFPGNSGGPLIDAASGKVVGVMSLAHTKSTREAALQSPSGISYAVPVHYVSALLGQR